MQIKTTFKVMSIRDKWHVIKNTPVEGDSTFCECKTQAIAAHICSLLNADLQAINTILGHK